METGRSCKMPGENGKNCGEKQDANTSQLPRLDVTLIYISIAPSDYDSETNYRPSFGFRCIIPPTLLLTRRKGYGWEVIPI
jgi:hypothetical protein